MSQKQSKKHISVRVRPQLYDELAEYREEHGLSKSVARRRLLEAGVEAEKEDDEEDKPPAYTTPQTALSWAGPFAAVGLLALVLGELVVAGGLIVTGSAMLVGGFGRLRGWF